MDSKEELFSLGLMILKLNMKAHIVAHERSYFSTSIDFRVLIIIVDCIDLQVHIKKVSPKHEIDSSYTGREGNCCKYVRVTWICKILECWYKIAWQAF